MYKVSKIYTRGKRVKGAIIERKNQNTTFHPSYQKKKKKKIAKFPGNRNMGNESHLLTSEGEIPVCAIRDVPATFGKVFSQTL